MDHTHCHDECEHKTLGYCKECDVAYCKDCGKEWPSVKWNWNYKPYTEPWKVTWDGTGFIPAGAHVEKLSDGTISYHVH